MFKTHNYQNGKGIKSVTILKQDNWITRILWYRLYKENHLEQFS